jgi:hypothetical protein
MAHRRQERTNTEVFRFRQDRLTQDFGVNTHPATVIVMPVLSDPVVHALPLVKVTSK